MMEFETLLTSRDKRIAELDELAVENFVDFVVPPVMQLLAGSFSGFPLPTYPGIQPTNVDIAQDGPSGDFVTVSADL